MLVIKLSFRNLFRNRRRTILSLSLIALGTAALFLFRGFSEDMTTAVKDASINIIWHLQIATESYWEGERHGYEHLISQEVLDQVKEILRAEPQVISYSTTLRLEGLIATEQKSAAFLAFGVEPANPVPDLEVKEGRRLKAGDLEVMLLPADCAEDLGVEVGDHLVVKAGTVDGLLYTSTVKVAGVYRRPFGIGGTIVIAPVSFVQMMRHTDRIARISVKLADEPATEEVALRLQTALENDLPGLKVRTWRELQPFHHQMEVFLGAIFGFVGLVIFLIVLFSVLEGLTMAFFERIREVGAVRAIGTRRHQIFGMFLSEGVLLGLFSGLVGVALGWGIGGLINIAGLTYPSPLAPDPMPFRIALGLHIAWMPFLVALVATAISAIYPAYRAAKIEIADAMRHV